MTKKKRISITPKILELNNSNDIFMRMDIVILSDEVNYNGAEFQKSYIEGIVNNKNDYIGIPFLVNREKLESGEFDNLTHELDLDTGELKTDQIGSFVDFWEEEIDGANCLLGSIRIFKRFSQTCSHITNLVSEDLLETSCEVLVKNYSEVSEDGIRKIDYDDGNNPLIGSAIVTQGAEKRAKPTLLIAEAYKQDIELEQKGGEKLPKEAYNKGIKVEYIGLESASLRPYEIEQQIYATVNPLDAKTGHREYNYYIHTLYNDKVILEAENNYNLYSAEYSVENDTIVLAPQDEWKKGSYQFVPEGVTVAELMEQNTDKIKELQSELDGLKEEKENMSKNKELTVEELNEKIESLETEISELKEKNEGLEATIVSQKEKMLKAEETAKELNATIEELKPFKEQVEKAELEAKQAELSNKFKKVMSEETFASEEVAEAIKNLDEAKLNSIVVAEIAKTAVETASKDEEVVEISASTQGDLVEPTILQKYGL